MKIKLLVRASCGDWGMAKAQFLVVIITDEINEISTCWGETIYTEKIKGYYHLNFPFAIAENKHSVLFTILNLGFV